MTAATKPRVPADVLLAYGMRDATIAFENLRRVVARLNIVDPTAYRDPLVSDPAPGTDAIRSPSPQQGGRPSGVSDPTGELATTLADLDLDGEEVHDPKGRQARLAVQSAVFALDHLKTCVSALLLLEPGLELPDIRRCDACSGPIVGKGTNRMHTACYDRLRYLEARNRKKVGSVYQRATDQAIEAIEGAA